MRYAFAWTVLVGVSLLLFGCGGSGAQFCFNSTGDCRLQLDQSPKADAGPDLEAVAGETVMLDGGDSSDDRRIDGYAWAQESGPAVAIVDATNALAQFVAPDVVTMTDLLFRLVITDSRGQSDEDVVKVTVSPRATAAIRIAVARLNGELLPQPLQDALPIAGTRAPEYLGLWLAARVLAAEQGHVGDIDELLDQLRLLSIRSGTAATEASAAFEALAFKLVARFTVQRDPGTFERANGRAGRATEPASELLLRIPDQFLSDSTPATLISVVRRSSDPVQVAAAAIALLQLRGGLPPSSKPEQCTERLGAVWFDRKQ